jgi:hypothetical protein
MPWKGRQAQAIFLKKRREVGEAGARRYMRAHGNTSARSEAVKRELRKKKRPH